MWYSTSKCQKNDFLLTKMCIFNKLKSSSNPQSFQEKLFDWLIWLKLATATAYTKAFEWLMGLGLVTCRAEHHWASTRAASRPPSPDLPTSEQNICTQLFFCVRRHITAFLAFQSDKLWVFLYNAGRRGKRLVEWTSDHLWPGGSTRWSAAFL